MKSIRDWRSDKELEREINEALGVNVSSVRNVFGAKTSNKVDPALRASLRTKILQISREHPELNPLNLFREIMKVVGMLIWKLSGTSMSASKFSSVVNQDQNEWAVIRTVIQEMSPSMVDAPEIDPGLAVRTAGSRLETDSKIKSALKVAFDHIKKYPEYKDVAPSELFDKMRDALLLLSSETKGNTGSTRMAVDKINDDPIAKETG